MIEGRPPFEDFVRVIAFVIFQKNRIVVPGPPKRLRNGLLPLNVVHRAREELERDLLRKQIVRYANKFAKEDRNDWVAVHIRLRRGDRWRGRRRQGDRRRGDRRSDRNCCTIIYLIARLHVAIYDVLGSA